MTPNFGWVKDKYDKYDYLHKRMPPAVAIPKKISLSHFLTDVRDQGNVGSCVGFGIGINLNAVKMALGIYKEWASPTWIYNGARYLAGNLNMDVGCQPRDALKWILDNGILLEHFWPYDPNNLDRSAPSSRRMNEATKYKGFSYFRAVDGVNGICDAIAQSHLVSIGAPWFREWWESPPCGRLPVPTTSSATFGGHETCLFGYDTVEGIFFGVNSWGTSWGDHGLFQMPFEAFDVFKHLGGYDAHYMSHTAQVTTTSPTSGCFLKRLAKKL